MADLNVIPIGATYHYLTIVKEIEPKLYVNRGIRKNIRMVLVRCVCGTEKVLRWSKIKSEWTKSCGCMRSELRAEKYVPPIESGNLLNGSAWVVNGDTAVLSTSKKLVTISASDVEVARNYRWYIGPRYVHGFDPITAKKTSLHRVILNPGSGFVVDHINGDGFDNTRENLRVCTHAENIRNSKVKCGRYKGVRKYGNRWYARIKVNYKEIHIGSFANKEDAAIAYDNAAKKYHGEFARTNF